MTLRELLEAFPTLADRPVVLLNSNGDFEYVGAAAMVYSDYDYEEDGEEVLVFATN